MPRKLKFEEESEVLTIRVPKSLFNELKEEFEWVISYRIQKKELPSKSIGLLQDELNELSIDSMDLIKLKKELKK